MGGGGQPTATPGPAGTPAPEFSSAVYGAMGMGPEDPEWQAAMRGRDLQDMWNKANQLLQDKNLQGDQLTEALQRIGVDHRMFPLR